MAIPRRTRKTVVLIPVESAKLFFAPVGAAELNFWAQTLVKHQANNTAQKFCLCIAPSVGPPGHTYMRDIAVVAWQLAQRLGEAR